MESIYQLTRHQICGNMCCTAYNRQESTSSPIGIRSELDCDGGGTGEGARDGGAEIATKVSTVITAINTITITCSHIIRSTVALSGGSVIDLHPVLPAIIISNLSIQSFKGEGDCLSIGWLQLPNLQKSIQSQGKHQDQIAITCS